MAFSKIYAKVKSFKSAIMNSSRSLILVLFVFLISCNENPNIDLCQDDNILAMYNKEINQILTQEFKIDMNYFYDDSQYLDYAESVFNNMFHKKLKTTDTCSVEYILKNLPKPSCFDKPLTNFEKEFIKIFVSFLTQNDIEKKIKIFNFSKKFVIQQIRNELLKEKLLFEMASIKLVFLHNLERINDDALNTKSGTLTKNDIMGLKGKAFDKCFDKCMNKTFSKMNPVKWVQFALNPPAYVAWHAGSCVYDCAI